MSNAALLFHCFDLFAAACNPGSVFQFRHPSFDPLVHSTAVQAHSACLKPWLRVQFLHATIFDSGRDF